MTNRTLTGRLRRTRFGYGFVEVEDEAQPNREDLFIPPFSMGGALHGDRVRVAYLETREQGDAHEVVEVLERTGYGIAGRLESRGRLTVLRPDRPEYPDEILLTLHGRATVPRGGRALVRLVAHPPEPLVGKVVAVFSDDDPSEDSLLVALEEGIAVEFDPAAETEAASFGEESVARAARGREDFRDDLVVTIDPPDAKDHDDALSIRRDPDGRGWEVGIHIADVSHYVRPGTALERDARSRGTSAYLADRVFPMLPHALSSGLCSLSEGDDRLVVTVVARIGPDGVPRGARVVEGVIRSRASLTYDEAWTMIESGTGEMAESLRALDQLARAMRARRLEAGGLELDLPEYRAVLDARGEPTAFAATPHVPTHSLIEEFMLLANQVVGGRAFARELPFMYRVHERPRYDKLRAFFEAARYLGRQGPEMIVTDARQLKRWLSRGHSVRDRLLNTLLLRALEKARYDLVDVGHFGLGMRGYAHFTSPIRRYPDLANHRVVKRYLLDGATGHGDPWTFTAGWLDAATAALASEMEMKADDAERGVMRRKAVRFARERVGEPVRGTVVAVTPGGLFVTLEGWNIDGFLPKRAFGDASFQMAEHGFSYRSKRSKSRFGLGDFVTVVVTRADLDRREVELGLAPSKGRASRRPARRAAGGRRRR
ncbi:MAG TPA: VacB/RNase II family 3'-5' exoribonuclease [Candidatus Eisenbacteria bacterium]|nr:VacB/RNase II family 3'-5' exoribonuclease [Candidatus Eisenbacteria bacterium]